MIPLPSLLERCLLAASMLQSGLVQVVISLGPLGFGAKQNFWHSAPLRRRIGLHRLDLI